MSGKDEKPVVLFPTECGCGYLELESICANCGACVSCCSCSESELEVDQCQECRSYEFVRVTYNHRRVVCDVESRIILHDDDTLDQIDDWECAQCGELAPYAAQLILDRMV